MKAEDKKKILEKYVSLNEQLKVLEAELGLLKKIVKEEIREGAPGYEVTINQMERESFSLKEARENLSKSMLEKIQGFIKKTQYEALLVRKA